MKLLHHIKLTKNNLSEGEQKQLDLLNKRIDNLNKLINELNATQDKADKKELLFEINHYSQYILNKFPNQLLTINDSNKIPYEFQEQLFNGIKESFISMGCKTLTPKQLHHFELTGFPDINQSLESEHFVHFKDFNFDEFFNTPQIDPLLFSTVNGSVKKLNSEQNPKTICQYLAQIKNALRVIIAENDFESIKNAKLRNIIHNINLNIKRLESVDYSENYFLDDTSRVCELIADMNEAQIRKFSSIFAMDHLESLSCDPKNKSFFENYSISELGGFNTKNFLMTNLLNQAKFVLRFDLGFGSPRIVSALLHESPAFNDLILPEAIKRQSFGREQYDIYATEFPIVITVTPYCNNADVLAYRKQFKGTSKLLNCAVDIFSQMASACELFRSENLVFPDMKNTNWLVDETGKIKVSDLKSIRKLTHGLLDFDVEFQEGFNNASTLSHAPPEIVRLKEKPELSVPLNPDAIHAYMLGKNIYQFLEPFKFLNYFEKHVGKKEVHDGENFDYSSSIFATQDGKKFRQLIEALVKFDPEKRMSVFDALKELSLLKIPALKRFSKLIEENPTNVEAYVSRGIAYQEQGNLDAAILDFTTALNLNPLHNDALNNREITYRMLQDFKSSSADVARLLKIDPSIALQIILDVKSTLEKIKSDALTDEISLYCSNIIADCEKVFNDDNKTFLTYKSMLNLLEKIQDMPLSIMHQIEKIEPSVYSTLHSMPGYLQGIKEQMNLLVDTPQDDSYKWNDIYANFKALHLETKKHEIKISLIQQVDAIFNQVYLTPNEKIERFIEIISLYYLIIMRTGAQKVTLFGIHLADESRLTQALRSFMRESFDIDLPEKVDFKASREILIKIPEKVQLSLDCIEERFKFDQKKINRAFLQIKKKNLDVLSDKVNEKEPKDRDSKKITLSYKKTIDEAEQIDDKDYEQKNIIELSEGKPNY